MKHSCQHGFLVLEILIAGIILTASIAATMYLFRMGYDYLEKANQVNVLSSKLVQAAGLLRSLDMEKKSGVEDMGDDVTLKWEAQLLGSARPIKGGGEYAVISIYELFLYRVNFSLAYQNTSRDYQTNVFRYKPLYFPGTAPP